MMKEDLIAGEIDFYIDGTLLQQIKLLVKGHGITEQMYRFIEQGKYFPLHVLDYAVVDFPGNKPGKVTDVIPHTNRFTVCF